MTNGNDAVKKLISSERISIATMRQETNKIFDKKLLALDELELRMMKTDSSIPLITVVDDSIIESDIITKGKPEKC